MVSCLHFCLLFLGNNLCLMAVQAQWPIKQTVLFLFFQHDPMACRTLFYCALDDKVLVHDKVTSLPLPLPSPFSTHLAQVVQRAYNVIHQRNQYSVDSVVCCVITYTVNRDFIGEQTLSTLCHLGPGVLIVTSWMTCYFYFTRVKNIHLIPKWQLFQYPFVCLQISPCYLFQGKIFF